MLPPNTPQTQGATEVNAPIAPLATTSLTWYFHRWTESFNNTNTTNKHHIPSIGATCCKSHQHHHFRPWHLASCLQQPVQSSPQSFHPLAAAVPNSAAKSRKAMVGAVHGGVNHVVKKRCSWAWERWDNYGEIMGIKHIKTVVMLINYLQVGFTMIWNGSRWGWSTAILDLLNISSQWLDRRVSTTLLAEPPHRKYLCHPLSL